MFPYRDPLFIKPAVPSPKVSDPIPPFPHQGSKSGEGELPIGDPVGSGGSPAAPVGNTPVDRSQRDPSLDKVPKQEASTQEVMRPTRGILHPLQAP